MSDRARERDVRVPFPTAMITVREKIRLLLYIPLSLSLCVCVPSAKYFENNDDTSLKIQNGNYFHYLLFFCFVLSHFKDSPVGCS